MPRYDGIVTSLKGEDRAEVIIRPTTPGIPGTTEEVNRQVCHCVTDGSAITIEAVNVVGAGVGDWVSVRREIRAIMKNVATLLGVPVAGTTLGIVFAVIFTDNFAFRIGGGIIGIASGLLLGIVCGVLFYRKVSGESEAFIEQVIKTRSEMAAMSGEDRCPLKKLSVQCDGCVGPFPYSSSRR